MEKKLKIGASLGKIYRTVWYSLGHLLMFGLLYALVVKLVVKPAITLIFSVTMRMKGYPILLNADIAGFFTSLSGIITAVIMGILAGICVYYEFSTMLHLLKISERKKPANLAFCMEKSLFSLSSLRSLETIGFILYAVVILPLFSLGMNSTLLPQMSIPNFILGEVKKHKGGWVLLALLAVGGFYLFIRLFYVFPVMVFEGKTFFKACGRSVRLTKKSVLRTFVIALLSLLSGMVVMLIPTFVFMQVRGWFFLPFKAASFLLLVVGASLIPGLSACASLTCYENFVPPFAVEQEDLRVKAFDSNLRKTVKKILTQIEKIWMGIKGWLQKVAPAWLSKRPYILLIVLLVPVVILSDVLIPLTFEQQGVVIVGHRGSMDGVENTIEAIQGAINQGADYAEIDVLLSADQVPMVIHDDNLSRLTGYSNYVYNLTAEELGKISVRNRGMTGKISTLEEVCDFSNGKIKLLIEFKTHGKERDSIVSKTVEVIQDKGMESQVQYQTLEGPLFQEMKFKYPDYPMGFIIVGHFGKLSARKILKLDADFLGVEEYQVTTQLIKAAHRAGKPIYVWTINDSDTAESFFDMEVDGIITDYPEEMRKTVKEAAEEEALEKES